MTRKTIPARFARAVLLAATLALCGSAYAHGDAAHVAGPVKKEQKDWGIAADPRPGQRTVTIRMLDTLRFAPDRIEVREGETLRLVVRNVGALRHELVLGTKGSLDAHAQMMASMPDMQHDEPYMAHVAPGRSSTLVWTFNRAGEFDFACLVAGHYQAGMVGTIVVAPLKVRPAAR